MPLTCGLMFHANQYSDTTAMRRRITVATATTTPMITAVTPPELGRKGGAIVSLQAGGGSVGLTQHTRMQTHTYTPHTTTLVCPTCMQRQNSCLWFFHTKYIFVVKAIAISLKIIPRYSCFINHPWKTTFIAAFGTGGKSSVSCHRGIWTVPCLLTVCRWTRHDPIVTD